MQPNVTETTNPATADFGMRTFDIKLTDNHVIEVAIAQRVRDDCPGEIHSTDELLICNQVTKNGDVFAALMVLQDQLAATLPSAQSL